MFLKLLSMYVGEERMGKFEPTDSIPGPRPCVSPGATMWCMRSQQSRWKNAHDGLDNNNHQ